MTATEPLAAVLWDMDGTLVDTEPCWMAAEKAIADEYGVEWTTADAFEVVGKPIEVSAAALIARGVPQSVETVAERLIAAVAAEVEAHVPWQPGAQELLAELRAADIPCALVTMSYPVVANSLLAVCPPGTFGAVVTGDQVVHGKPSPEGYLEAAARLGVDVNRCVAIEDSPSGISAAMASGAATIAMQVVVPVEERPGLSRTDDLRRIDLDRLRSVLAGEAFDDLVERAPVVSGRSQD